ncbi:huntingtin-interacting 1-like [Chlorella sorokiniana]|uniref:Huntingtin-interacting 1-like n=1 Tax=Chlorella sorokiniana TaxID=3076 RepID=A0A2P6U2T7_CHLSO|nr:huntingtin-interacting 1-like [Chlorella sorokiniana]|eukprot:PRW60627.1 huntingtin-interacting 1-like [Chlorella sorokiniana]
MAPLPPTARCSLARIEQRLQQLVDDSAPLDGSEAGDEGRSIGGGAAGAATAAAQFVTDAPASCPQPLNQAAPGQPGAPCYSQQLELARLRRERDEAVKEQQAALRRERDGAVSEAAQLRSQLHELQQVHAALEQQHAQHTRQAEQAAAATAAERAAQAAQMERLQAAHAAVTADSQRKSLRIEALETQQAVLLESYRFLEAELRGSATALPPAQARSLTRLPPHPRSPQLATAGDPPYITDLVPSRGAALASEGDAVERLALSHSHLALAVRCAELQFALGQADRRVQAAEVAAMAAEEQAAGLRLLLAKASSGSAAALQQRLDAACGQLEEAQELGAQLRRQLAQKEEALALVAAEKRQLQADLRLMLQAKAALAALAGGLSAAAGRTGTMAL